jgi:hypothetical protein
VCRAMDMWGGKVKWGESIDDRRVRLDEQGAVREERGRRNKQRAGLHINSGVREAGQERGGASV